MLWYLWYFDWSAKITVLSITQPISLGVTKSLIYQESILY